MNVVGGARRYSNELLAVIVLGLIGTVVAAIILTNQRLRFPWEEVVRIEAEFAHGQAVTPGQGQPVNVAGVKVGEIGEVRLEDGRALVGLDIDPNELDAVYSNARMLLRPRTGLNDMSVQLDPGRAGPGVRKLEDGDRVGIANTAPNVNPDEILASVDADSRRYLSVFANAGGRGLRGRGDELRELIKATEPTLEHTARVSRAIADRRHKLSRLISNLRRLSGATAAKDEELASLIAAASDVLGTLGRREEELRESLERAPGALGSTRDALAAARSLADELGPAAEALRPTIRDLAPALVDSRPLLRTGTPVLREDLRPLVREARPLLRDLRPSVTALNTTTPDLTRAGKVLNYVANELGYNPEGPEEGYLFWTAWFYHNASNILGVEDAHGATWRGLAMVGCSTAAEIANQVPLLEPLTDSAICPPPSHGAERR